MGCLRCNGLMVYERFCDLLESISCFRGWRCVLCGDIIDPIILANRKENRRQKMRPFKRRWRLIKR